MKPLEEQTFYELLDVPADASAEQIEQAFAKAMLFYGPESLATYSLAGGEESKQLLERIEEAYLTLSDSGLRGDYDRLLQQAAVPVPSDVRPAAAPVAPAESAATAPISAPISAPIAAPVEAAPAVEADPISAVEAPVAVVEADQVPADEADPVPADEQVAAAGFGPPSRAGQLAFTPILEAVRHFPWPGSRPEGEDDDEAPCPPPAATPEPAPIEQPPAQAAAPAEPRAEAASEPVTEPAPAVAAPALEPVVIDSSEIVELAAEQPPVVEPEPEPAAAVSSAVAASAETPSSPSAELPAPVPSVDESGPGESPVEPEAIVPPPLPHATVSADPPGVQAVELSEGAPASASLEAGGQSATSPAPTEAEAPPPARPEEPPTEVSVSLVVSSEASRPAAAPAPAPEPVAPPPPKVEEPKPAPRPLPRMPEILPNAVFNGELLRRVREGRGLTARELADRTKIGLSHVENIEADRYGPLPTAVYLRGFLMLIARELKLDPLKVSKSYLEQVARDSGKKSG
jgi:cytoskeletal protein RodZ